MAAQKDINMDEVRGLLAQGLTIKQIAKHMGHTFTTIKMRLDPYYAAMRKQRINELRSIARYGRGRSHVTTTRRAASDDVDERLQEIPHDTRTKTARLCGDPLPGRSALDQRNNP